ncbi:MAG: hypothetical protein PHU85_19835, partial [Phycisphaerae bacterium]|nr:hypothetical protein [Phycisphaerae bacterium]
MTDIPSSLEPRRSNLLGRAWPFLFFAVATVAYHWQILASPTDQIAGSYDMRDYVYWVHSYAR